MIHNVIPATMISSSAECGSSVSLKNRLTSPTIDCISSSVGLISADLSRMMNVHSVIKKNQTHIISVIWQVAEVIITEV